MLLDIVEPKSLDDLRNIATLAEHMGIKYLLVETSKFEHEEQILRHLQNEFTRLKMIPIITVDPSQHMKKAFLQDMLGRKIIFMKTESREEFIRGIRIPNISVMSISLEAFLRFFDIKIIHLLRQYHKFVELRFGDFIFASPRTRANYIRLFKQQTRLLNNQQLRLIISTRATSMYELISPRLLRECLLMLGLKDYIIKKICKLTPKELILTPLEVTIVKTGSWLENLVEDAEA